MPFNGTVPIKRARMDLTTTGSKAAQLRRRKEAEKEYGRGRKIPGSCVVIAWFGDGLTTCSEVNQRQEIARKPKSS